MSENSIHPRVGDHRMHVVISGAAKRPVKIVKRLESNSMRLGQSSKELGLHNGKSSDDAFVCKANEPTSPKFAKVYPAWQGYWIKFKLRKDYHPIATRRIGYRREQPEKIRQTRRRVWERMVPNSSSLDLLERVEINTETLDEIREILAGKWNQTTNNFDNRLEWFRRRLGELGLSAPEIRLVLASKAWAILPSALTAAKGSTKEQSLLRVQL